MRWSFIAAAVIVGGSLHAGTVTELATPDVRPQFSKAAVRVVNVWATWCVPCVEEMDDLKRLDDSFTDTQVQLLGISLDDALPGKRDESKKRVDAFLRRKAIAFRNFYYTGRVPALQDHYAFEGEIPLTVIYDRHGKERARYQGRINLATVRQTIQKLLKER
jgi:thiol-disulfide isomerase/thioredoxin